MVTRISDEVPSRKIFSDEFGLTVYGGLRGRNYTVKGPGNFETEILFQTGYTEVSGVDGLTNEVLLAIVKDRLILLDKEVPCSENQVAIESIEHALMALDARMYRRHLVSKT